MQTFVLAMSLATLASSLVGAQSVPRVEQIPIAVSAKTPGMVTIDMRRHSYADRSQPPLKLTIVIDSLFAWSALRDSHESFVVAQQRVLGTMRCEDVRAFEVVEGEDAVARGACPGTLLLLISTKTGRWRPTDGIATSRTMAYCGRVPLSDSAAARFAP